MVLVLAGSDAKADCSPDNAIASCPPRVSTVTIEQAVKPRDREVLKAALGRVSAFEQAWLGHIDNFGSRLVSRCLTRVNDRNFTKRAAINRATRPCHAVHSCWLAARKQPCKHVAALTPDGGGKPPLGVRSDYVLASGSEQPDSDDGVRHSQASHPGHIRDRSPRCSLSAARSHDGSLR